MQQPIITATSLIGVIDTMIMAIKFSASAKNYDLFEDISQPLVDFLDDKCHKKYLGIPKKLFTKVHEKIQEAYECLEEDDADLLDLPDDEIPPRGTQKYYQNMCDFVILDDLMPAKALLEAYIVKTNAKKVTNMIMAKRLSTYNEDSIGTIADLPNTVIDKIANMAKL